MGENDMAYLAITDADRIHDYVFSPHELRLVRGGSRLQKQANDEAGRLAEEPRFKGTTIFADGGTVLARFPDKDHAISFCKEVSNLYRRKTAIATVSHEIVEHPPSAHFIDIHSELRDKLEVRKQSRAGEQLLPVRPFWVSCEACGEFAASVVSLRERKRICEACRLRDERGSREEDAAESFEDIARDARPQNYLAIVYIDIDGLGEFFAKHVQSESDYGSLAKRIGEVVRDSVNHGLARVSKSEQLLVGGDDAVVALPAQHAVEFIQDFSWKFRSSSFAPAPERPTFSIGLAIAHSHYPIAEFMRIANDLQKSAKRIKGADAIDYEVVASSMTGHVVKQRECADGRARTGRPLLIGDPANSKTNEGDATQGGLSERKSFFDMVRAVRNLKDLDAPVSQVKSLYPVAFEGTLQSELDYLNVLARVRPDVRSSLIQAVGSRLWREERDRIYTVAADLVELWEFVDASKADD